MKGLVGEKGMVGAEDLGDALGRNGVIVSRADAESVWDAIVGTGREKVSVEETVSKLKPTPTAGKGTIEEWGERFKTPAFVSGMVGNDIFSGVQQVREKKHFKGYDVGGKDTITKDVLGMEREVTGGWTGDGWEVTESAPYHLDGQHVEPPPPPGRDIHARKEDYGGGEARGGQRSPMRTPYALQTELGGEIGRSREEAEGNPGILVRSRERAEVMRREKRCGRSPRDDVVWLCMPDVGYKRTLDMTRSEIFQVLNRMDVKVKGGDMERLWWWMEKKEMGFSREDFYRLLGGVVVKEEGKVVGGEGGGGSEDELSVEKRRKLHSVCLKANAIIRGCAALDGEGEGKVPTGAFVDALKKNVDIADDDIQRVLGAVQGGQEDKSYVKYSGLVFKIGLYLDKFVVVKEEKEVEVEKEEVRRSEDRSDERRQQA